MVACITKNVRKGEKRNESKEERTVEKKEGRDGRELPGPATEGMKAEPDTPAPVITPPVTKNLCTLSQVLSFFFLPLRSTFLSSLISPVSHSPFFFIKIYIPGGEVII